MRLESFQVKVFRNVVDSGSIKVVDSTCIVGKNEAGKSSVIEALHRLNPAKPISFDLLDDYPRWLKKEHEIAGVIDDAVPITATFTFSDEEKIDLESRFGKGVLTKYELVAKRKYEGDLIIELAIDHAKFIKRFLDDNVEMPLKKKLSTAKTSTELLEVLGLISAEIGENNEPTPEAQAAKIAKAALQESTEGTGSLTAALERIVRPLIPKTFYFSNYSQLRGRYNLIAEVIPALTKPSPDEEIQAAADFLKLARVTAQNVQTWEFEQWRAELEAVSSLLTKRVKENWKQNEHLKLEVTIEAVQNASGQPERFLQFRVDDTRHNFTSRLDRRSTGFRWFVSFIASFFEFEADKKIILLLDEPGLSLHARAQKDLLDAIDTNLTKGRQVIYMSVVT